MASAYAKYEDSTLRKVLAVALDGSGAEPRASPPVVHLAGLAQVRHAGACCLNSVCPFPPASQMPGSSRDRQTHCLPYWLPAGAASRGGGQQHRRRGCSGSAAAEPRQSGAGAHGPPQVPACRPAGCWLPSVCLPVCMSCLARGCNSGQVGIGQPAPAEQTHQPTQHTL